MSGCGHSLPRIRSSVENHRAESLLALRQALPAAGGEAIFERRLPSPGRNVGWVDVRGVQAGPQKFFQFGQHLRVPASIPPR